MPATVGIMVTRCRYYRLADDFLVADTQFLSLDTTALAQFGVDDPSLIIGTHMSDWQDSAWRQMGHQRYLQRKLGQPVSKDYVVEIKHPDGRRVYQRREFAGWMHGKDPDEDMYLTYIEAVREVPHGPIIRALDPEEKKLARRYNGDCTVADLRRMANDPSQLPLALRETFPHIIRECKELSSGYFAGKHPSPLDLALSDDVAVCWREATTQKGHMVRRVRPRFGCERCGWRWFGTIRDKAECPAAACGKHFREYRKQKK